MSAEAADNNRGSCPKDGIGQPPPLSIKLPKLSELPKKSKPWSDVQLPVDILLVTVEDCEFLACYAHMKNVFKSYRKDLGFVYFGNAEEDEDEPLKIALVTCSEGSSSPGGSQTVVKNAVTQLRPKAVYSVGCCIGLKQEKAQLGDVVVCSKLTTGDFRTPVGRDIGNLFKCAAHGWKAPLESPEAREVHVHCDGEILSSINQDTFERHKEKCPTAIAVEMEGQGIFVAAHDMKIEWVIVKGVSGFAGGVRNPNESWKAFACVMAASVVFNMLGDPVVYQQWPHYQATLSEDKSTSIPKRKPSKRNKPTEPFVLGECQNQLRSKYYTLSKVKILPWDGSSAVDIDEIYTQLTWLKDDRKPSGVTQERLKDYIEIFSSPKHYTKPKRLLVYGRPGIGKTTFSKKAAFDWSQQRKQIVEKFDLVLLIRLRCVCDLEDVQAILRASELLAVDGVISVENLYDYVLQNQEKVLIILDGYDEYTAGKQSPVRDIWEKKQLRDCCVIVTTRETETDELRVPSDAQFEINGYDSEDQIKKFALKFLKVEEEVEEFYKYLEDQDLKDMAKIPLMLLMLCLLWKEKNCRGLPTSRANIFTQFIQTLLNHNTEKGTDADLLRKVVGYTEEFAKIGKLAFDALLRNSLCVSLNEVPADLPIKTLSTVGLFQISNLSGLDPDKGVFFIHKSVQEFLAAWYLKEELLPRKDGNIMSLSKLDSIEKIFKMSEVLKFTSELSGEAACAVVSHLGNIAKREGLTEEPAGYEFGPIFSRFNLDTEDLYFLMLTAHIFFCCPPLTRRELFSVFISYLGGVLLLNADQLRKVANENLLKFTTVPNFILFTVSKHPERAEAFFVGNDILFSNNPEKAYRDLITVVEDLNAVVVSCSGEMKATDFLKKYPFRPVDHFFLQKDDEHMHLYFDSIVQKEGVLFPTEMLKELIASPESVEKKKPNADQSSEQDNRTALCLTENTAHTSCPTHHCLSLVWFIYIWDADRPVIKTLTEVLPLIKRPSGVEIYGKDGGAYDAQLTETLVSRVNFTDILFALSLCEINLTAKSAGIIAKSLSQCSELRYMRFPFNPLGDGVSVLTKHLSCVPYLVGLNLEGVKMTKKQVYHLNAVVRQSKIYIFHSEYHYRDGNPLPENEWPSEEFWKEHPEGVAESSAESGDEQEPGSSAESGDKQAPGSSAESGDKRSKNVVVGGSIEERPGQELDGEAEPAAERQEEEQAALPRPRIFFRPWE